MSEWVSVKDRLPETSEALLLCDGMSKGGHISYCVGYCRPDGTWFDGDYVDLFPTHWMPIPEAPKEDL